ncbi:MAG: ABC transporter ATP-binding protein [Christensenellales bacterium]|nr:ABC transporter ATP-binding protein [Christensenellales bacterium]
MTKPVAVQMKGISKYFGDVAANKNVNLTVYEGEILSVLGENGSGKTTLMNMLSGIYFPDEGEIVIEGEPVVIRSPRDAYKYRIGMVHQHFKLVDVFTALDNVILGEEMPPYSVRERAEELKEEAVAPRYLVDNDDAEAPVKTVRGTDTALGRFRLALRTSALPFVKLGKKLRFNWLPRRRGQEVRNIAAKYGFDIDLNKKIYDMSVSEKQTVEIIKVLYRGADILILDEPTAVLTPQETEKLFGVLRNMREDGKSIIIITHKLNEVMEISDRVAVLRKGEFIGTVNTSETNVMQLTEMMVGHKTELNIRRGEPVGCEERLIINGLSLTNHEGVKKLSDVSFTARSGEILGIAGIAGSGQRELLEAIAGLQRPDGGSITYNDPKTGKEENLMRKSPAKIRELGVRLSFVPEDRLGMGLVGSMDIIDNMMLRSYKRGKLLFLESKKGKKAKADAKKGDIKRTLKPKSSPHFDGFFLDRKRPKELAERIIKDLEVVTPSSHTPVRRLSGGNIQKVLVGREIAAAPTVLMVAYPVRGLDINSSYTIYNLLNEQKENGVAVIYVGEDLDVLVELCDRILVICAGRVTGILDGRNTTKEEIGLYMTDSADTGKEANE